MKTAVVLFARYPRAGQVKRRLAASIGDDAAVEFYRRCAERTFKECAVVDATRLVYASEAADLSLMREWVGPQFVVRAQTAGDVGERMGAMFDELFREGFARVVIVGTDIPQLRSAHVEQALALLNDHDAVSGPAHDGGYYLLGLRAPQPIFHDTAWSTPGVLAATRAKCAALGLTSAELEMLEDVDDGIAYARWERAAP